MHTGYAPLLLFAVPFIASTVSASQFSLKETFVGRDFLDKWIFETFDDPTHGRTNYVNRETAMSSNLSFATDDKFFMQADSTQTVQPGVRGRDSVRIKSATSSDQSIIILDLQHMPHGCATWPAFWSLSAKGEWPAGGEIDIIEGVNNQARNLASLHTSPSCSMPKKRNQTGTVVSTDCDVNTNYNQGCGNSFTKAGSYGKDFNKSGGGYYALARTKNDGIRVWFWSRREVTTPPDVKAHLSTLNPELWGTPEAYFPVGKQCDYTSHLDAHNLVFDLTFCGDWAGSAWSLAGCGAGSCNDYVDNNPAAFVDAYWEINSLRVYSFSG